MKPWKILFLLVIINQVSYGQLFDDENATDEKGLKEDLSVHYNQIKLPNRDFFLKILVQIKQNSAIVLDKEDKMSRLMLDTKVANAKYEEVEALANMFFLRGYATGATYLYAIAAEKKSTDSTIVQNLGVCLKNIKQPFYAYQVLLYAQSLTHRHTIVQVNLGWVAASVGDLNTAKKHFEMALSFDAKNYQAMNGLAEVASARALISEAMNWRKLAWQKQFTFAGARQKKEEQTAQIKKINQTENNNLTAALPPVDDILPIIEYEDRPVGGNHVSNLSLPNPPLEYSFEMIRSLNDHLIIEQFHQNLIEENQTVIGENMNKLSLLAEKWNEKSKPKVIDNKILIPYPYVKQLAALDYYEQLFTNRVLAFQTRFLRSIKVPRAELGDKYIKAKKENDNETRACGDNTPCMNKAQIKYCQSVQAMLKVYHSYFYEAWSELFQKTQKDIKSYDNHTVFYIQTIRDTDLNQYVNLRRGETVRLLHQTSLAHAEWFSWTNNAANTYCEIPEPIEDEEVIAKKVEEFKKHQKLKIWKDGTDCVVPTWNIDAGVIESEATCDKLSIAFTAPPPSPIKGTMGAEVRWGKDWGDDEIEFQAGLKTESQGIVGAGAKMVEFITIKGGKVVDLGLKGEVTAFVNPAHGTEEEGKIGIKGEGKLEFSLSQSKGLNIDGLSGAWKATAEAN